MRISDWSSDVCSSDLRSPQGTVVGRPGPLPVLQAAGKGKVRMAVAGRRQGGGDAGAAGDAGRGDRLADAEADLIGSASCRERVCQYVSISVVAVPLTNPKHTSTNSPLAHDKRE